MSEDELRTEHEYWRVRFDQLGHRDAKKGAMNHARTIASVLHRRFGVELRGPAA